MCAAGSRLLPAGEGRAGAPHTWVPVKCLHPRVLLPSAVLAAAALLIPAAPSFADDGEKQRAPERVLEIKINLDALFGTRPAKPAPAPVRRPEATPAAVPAPRIHTVAPGESLSLIAALHGVNLDTVFTLNNMGWDTVIHPGQAIVVEAAKAVPAKVPDRVQAPAGSIPELVAATARSMGVDEALALAFAEQESNFTPGVVSSAGALGVMQVMPFNQDWASQLAGRPLDLSDTEDNVTAGVVIIRHLLEISPDLDTAIGSYYEGFHGVTSDGPLPETVAYTQSVKDRMAKFS